MARKNYEEDFKKKLVKIYDEGNRSYRSLSKEYSVPAPTIRTWVIKYSDSKDSVSDKRSKEEKETVKLRKEVEQLEIELIKLREKIEQLEMEKDILKQAALLLGKK